MLIFSDIVVRPLSISDAPIVNDLWTYKSPFTLNRIKHEIEHLPAFGNRTAKFPMYLDEFFFIFIFKGAYRNEELLSWTLTKYDGSVGTAFTQSEARGLGLGTMVNFYLASKLFEQQEQIFCYVAHDNIASLKMIEKLGYYRSFDIDWLTFSSK